jgi:hypothetical protein
MRQKQLDVFEKCLELLQAGAPLEECIKQYPEITLAMQELLEKAQNLFELGNEQIPAELIERSRLKLLTQTRALLADKSTYTDAGFSGLGKSIRQLFTRLTTLSPLAGKLVLIIGITGLLILFSSGLVITSAKSLPGDSLYPVKRAVEDFSIHIVPKHEARNGYEDNYSHQRVVEVKRLIELKRTQQITFEGILESMVGNNWMVSGIPINLSSDTTMIGGLPGTQSFEVGSVIEVEGKTTSLGWVSASEIHLREYKFIGTVEKINTTYWQISGNQIFISAGSQIDPGIREGDDVTLLIRSEDNGLYALAILHDIRPTPMPYQSPSTSSTTAEENQSVNGEEHTLNGILEKINRNYWVIGGEIVFIVDASDISENIKIGDALSVTYRVEINGSYTASEIHKFGKEDSTEEYQSQETPETGNDGESQDHPNITETSHEDDEESMETPKTPGTPEPTEDH